MIQDAVPRVELEQDVAARASPTSSEDAADFQAKRIKTEDNEGVFVNFIDISKGFCFYF